ACARSAGTGNSQCGVHAFGACISGARAGAGIRQRAARRTARCVFLEAPARVSDRDTDRGIDWVAVGGRAVLYRILCGVSDCRLRQPSIADRAAAKGTGFLRGGCKGKGGEAPPPPPPPPPPPQHT